MYFYVSQVSQEINVKKNERTDLEQKRKHQLYLDRSSLIVPIKTLLSEEQKGQRE